MSSEKKEEEKNVFHKMAGFCGRLFISFISVGVQIITLFSAIFIIIMFSKMYPSLFSSIGGVMISLLFIVLECIKFMLYLMLFFGLCAVSYPVVEKYLERSKSKKLAARNKLIEEIKAEIMKNGRR